MLLSFLFSIVVAGLPQPKDTGTCALLKAILKDSVSSRVFKLNRHPELSIRFLDMQGQLNSNCTFDPVFGKKVEVVFKPAHYFRSRPLDIMIQKVERDKERYKVHYFQPSTGAVGYILLKRKETGFKVVKVIHTQY